MAGSDPGFDATAFRTGIQFAMNMGAPPDPADQLSFHYEPQLVYTASADAEDVPFDFDASVQRTVPPPVKVPAAVEYYDDEGLMTNLGVAQPTRIKVTLLDEDYDTVMAGGDLSHVVIGGDEYGYRRTEPPSGLFDVGLFVLHFSAEQES